MPETVDLSNWLQTSGSERCLLGIDHLVRDILSRLLHGSLITVGINVLVLFFHADGVTFDLLEGYMGGKTDWELISIVETFIAFSEHVVGIVLSGILGPGIANMVIARLVLKWVGYAWLACSIIFQERLTTICW